MKKQLLALAILGSSLANAQVWSENFSSVTPTALPATWGQNNVDGLTVTTSLASWNFGNNAWVTWNYAADPAHGNVAVSTSWYTPAGTSNDWLITHAFTVPANGVLEWEATSTQAGFQDGYQVKISTTGTTVANFSTNLLTVAAETFGWNLRAINLSSYAGQLVYIAFVNNSNDKNRLYLDNIRVFVPPSEDGSVASITNLDRYTASATPNITGSFKSFGFTPAATAVLNYNVNNGATTTQTFTFGTPLNYAQAASYAFTTPANLSLGANKVKVWVSHVNGVLETNHSNDTITSIVYRASKAVTRSVLIEEWSSSTCPPCRTLNVTNGFNALLNSNSPNTGGDVNVIKYQMNWPSPNNDPSYNSHGLARRLHYDVNSVPHSLVNGRTEMNAHDQGEIDAGKAEDAFADITATLSATGSTNAAANHTVMASATITPWVTITSASPVRVYQALIQSSYHYTSCTTCTPATNPQNDYFHAMRKMNPNGWGTPTVITDGAPFTVTFALTPSITAIDPTLPPQNTYNFWISPNNVPAVKNDMVYEYVVFLQDTISNHVLQSASWSASVTVPTPTTTVGFKDLNANQQIGLFPNPAKDYVTLAIQLEKAASKVDVTIYDIAGKVVYTNSNTSIGAGKHNLNVSTSEFASGVYNVIIKADDAVLKDKLIINK
jgi:hypothetical protein